jgi:hypothetical protein
MTDFSSTDISFTDISFADISSTKLAYYQGNPLIKIVHFLLSKNTMINTRLQFKLVNLSLTVDEYWDEMSVDEMSSCQTLARLP